MDVRTLAQSAKQASRQLAVATREVKDSALASMANQLKSSMPQILAANAQDVADGVAASMSDSLIDRLKLTEDRVLAMAAGLEDLIGLSDPVGEVVRGWVTQDGLKINQVRVPFGLIGIIYEARPNVTADAAGICLKAGNACLLRGSKSALASNRAIVKALKAGLVDAGLSPDLICLVEGGHETTAEMMKLRGVIDVLIPRGGAGLINAVVNGSSVPVIETGTGNCHLYVDKLADFQMALEILVNAKTQRPSVCNTVETLLVHRDIAGQFVPTVVAKMAEKGVTVHACPVFAQFAGGAENVVAAGEGEFDEEYLSLDLAAKVVDDLDEAISHIHQYSSGHSETIITQDLAASEKFVAEVDAAAVLVNASSRFVDGGQFGFGAEIGISTQKLHARGPMGVSEMTSVKFIVQGQGQVRA